MVFETPKLVALCFACGSSYPGHRPIVDRGQIRTISAIGPQPHPNFIELAYATTGNGPPLVKASNWR
jgi:hypothetical protein